MTFSIVTSTPEKVILQPTSEALNFNAALLNFLKNLAIPSQCRPLTARQWSFLVCSQLLQKKGNDKINQDDFKLLAFILGTHSKEELQQQQEFFKTYFQNMLKDFSCKEDRSLIIAISMIWKQLDPSILEMKMEKLKSFEPSSQTIPDDVGIYKQLIFALQESHSRFGMFLQSLIKKQIELANENLELWGTFEGVKTDSTFSRKKHNQKIVFKILEDKGDLAFFRKCYEITESSINSLRTIGHTFDCDRTQSSIPCIENMGHVHGFLSEISSQCLSFIIHANILKTYLLKEEKAFKDAEIAFPSLHHKKRQAKKSKQEVFFDQKSDAIAERMKSIFHQKGYQSHYETEVINLREFFQNIKPKALDFLEDNRNFKQALDMYFNIFNLFFDEGFKDAKSDFLESWRECIKSADNLMNMLIGMAAKDPRIVLTPEDPGTVIEKRSDENCVKIKDAISTANLFMQACKTEVDHIKGSIAGAAAQSELDAYAIFEELEELSLKELSKNMGSTQPVIQSKTVEEEGVEDESEIEVSGAPPASSNMQPSLSFAASFLNTVNSQTLPVLNLVNESSRLIMFSIPGFFKRTAGIEEKSEAFLVRKEALGHLFHSCCGLEQFSALLLKDDLEGIAALFPMLLMDWHVLAEQLAVHQILRSGKPKPETHSLKNAYQECHVWDKLSPASQRHLKGIDQALLWSRYPVSSLYRCQEGKLTEGLQWMDFCLELQDRSLGLKPPMTKEELSKKIPAFVKYILRSHRESLTLFTDPAIDQEFNPEIKKLIELYSENGPVESLLLAKVGEFIKNYSAPKMRPSASQNQFEKAFGQLHEIEKKPHANRREGEILKTILGDAKHHFWRLSQYIRLQDNQKDTGFSSWHARNFMNIQWILEQLYLARYFVAEHKVQYIHDFKLFQMLLGDDANRGAKGADKPDSEKILAFNYGIGIHYPWKMAHFKKEFVEFAHAMEADRSCYSAQEGFQPKGKSGHLDKGQELLLYIKSSLGEGISQGLALLNLLKRETADQKGSFPK